MKFILFFLFIAMHTAVAAQKKKELLKDSTPVKTTLNKTSRGNKSVAAPSIAATIEKELTKIVAANCHLANTTATWTKIKQEADEVMMTHFQNGNLLGTSKEQAYFIRMDATTMNAADIAGKKMILIAGIAPNKPAEFIQLRVEQINTSN